MESGVKRGAPTRVWGGGILGLARLIPQRDVRKLIWAHLGADDRELVRCAHNSTRSPDFEDWGVVARFAGRGHLGLLKWVRKALPAAFSAELTTWLMAVACDDLAMMQWLRKHGCPWDEDACCYAALYGNLIVLQWLRASGCPWGTRTLAYAAWHGHIHVMEWARANGCAWDATACALAAQHNQLPTLQWLRAHGCPWDGRVVFNARWAKADDLLTWAEANGAPQ